MKHKQKLSILMVPVMAFYILLPCISQAETVKSPFINKTQTVHSVQQSTIPPTTGTIRYFYNGSTLVNAEDNNGDMSTYLSRTVRTIVNVNTKTVVDTQCLFTDGKNVISQTDSTGTNITSTQQYNAFGQHVSYTSSTNKQINKLTNQQLNILTNPFQYDGYYYDSESGLYYLNARYYSPTLMQFISMDSYDLANRYAYCDGNPIGNTDPTGHCIFIVAAVLLTLINIAASGGSVYEDIQRIKNGNNILYDALDGLLNVITGITDTFELKAAYDLYTEPWKIDNVLNTETIVSNLKDKSFDDAGKIVNNNTVNRIKISYTGNKSTASYMTPARKAEYGKRNIISSFFDVESLRASSKYNFSDVNYLLYSSNISKEMGAVEKSLYLSKAGNCGEQAVLNASKLRKGGYYSSVAYIKNEDHAVCILYNDSQHPHSIIDSYADKVTKWENRNDVYPNKIFQTMQRSGEYSNDKRPIYRLMDLS